MNIHYLLGIGLVLGIAFLGIFIASPSINTVQADEFVLLNGYRANLQNDVSSDRIELSLYNVELSYRYAKDGEPRPPMWVAGVNGNFFLTFNNASHHYWSLGSGAKISETLAILGDFDNRQYELLIRYDELGNLLLSDSVIAVIPPQYREGYYEIETVQSANEETGEMETVQQRLYHQSVCFDSFSSPYAESGRCEYYSTTDFATVGKSQKTKSPRLRA